MRQRTSDEQKNEQMHTDGAFRPKEGNHDLYVKPNAERSRKLILIF
jgi:hypothetical protein